MYVLALNERDHLALADVSTRSVRTVAQEVIVPTIVCYFKGSYDACVAFTWDKAHRAAAREMTQREGCCFSPSETYAVARAVEEGIEADQAKSWVLRKRETRGGMWLLDEREALASKPKIAPGSTRIPRVTNAAGFAWPQHETLGVTIGGMLAHFKLVPYLCVFPGEPMRVRPDPE